MKEDLTKPYVIFLSIFMVGYLCFIAYDITTHNSPASTGQTNITPIVELTTAPIVNTYTPTSSIYNTNSDAYKLTQLDVGGPPSESSSSSDFDRYNKIQSLLNEVETSFKPRTGKATTSDMTVTAWQELKKNNKPTSLLEILQLSTTLDKEGSKAITYAEYLTTIIIMTK